MDNPRSYVIVGVAFIAAAVLLATGTHGFWWLFGLAWAFGLFGGHGRMHACGRARHRRVEQPGTDRSAPTPARTPTPNPSQDQHVAFPAR